MIWLKVRANKWNVWHCYGIRDALNQQLQTQPFPYGVRWGKQSELGLIDRPRWFGILYNVHIRWSLLIDRATWFGISQSPSYFLCHHWSSQSVSQSDSPQVFREDTKVHHPRGFRHSKHHFSVQRVCDKRLICPTLTAVPQYFDIWKYSGKWFFNFLCLDTSGVRQHIYNFSSPKCWNCAQEIKIYFPRCDSRHACMSHPVFAQTTTIGFWRRQ